MPARGTQRWLRLGPSCWSTSASREVGTIRRLLPYDGRLLIHLVKATASAPHSEEKKDWKNSKKVTTEQKKTKKRLWGGSRNYLACGQKWSVELEWEVIGKEGISCTEKRPDYKQTNEEEKGRFMVKAREHFHWTSWREREKMCLEDEDFTGSHALEHI